jgi:hypothetical protein
MIPTPGPRGSEDLCDVFACSCEPDKGSESRTGWAWSRMIARQADAVALTSTANGVAIERALPKLPKRQRPRFVHPRSASRARLETGLEKTSFIFIGADLLSELLALVRPTEPAALFAVPDSSALLYLNRTVTCCRLHQNRCQTHDAIPAERGPVLPAHPSTACREYERAA